MDSLSFNKAHNINAANQKVSFSGQKSIMNTKGEGIYRFYAPPYDSSEYLAALEVVSVDNEKNSSGRGTKNLSATGNPVLFPASIEALRNNRVFDISEKQLKALGLNKDLVGYRFVLLDKKAYNETKNIDSAKNAAGNKYLLDSGITASSGDDKYSYFSKKQGFVNKIGPMYHIFPDSYNTEAGNEDFVRSAFNKAGGNIQGIIEKLKETNSELDPYEMIITTPLFGADDVTSHGYWTANPFQIASTKGTLEDFKEFQEVMFDYGKAYVTDGAFTSFGLQSPQVQHVLKWGKASPFYNWVKFDKNDAPNTNIKLGVFPETIISGSTDKNSESYKKQQTLLENICFKVVNPKNIESEKGNRNSKLKPNPDYNSEKPTYIQFYDKRLAGKEADDLNNLITFYENQTPKNHYDIATHKDSVQPFYFEVDPNDTRFKTRGASLKQLQDEGKGLDTFFQMGNYTITTKNQTGGATSWDGQVDLFKANISSPSSDSNNIIGNKQVKNHYYNLASYWTKLTDDVLVEHIAKNIGQKGNSALKDIAQKHRLGFAEISMDKLSDVIESPAFLENFNKKFKGKSNEDIVLDGVVNFPLESVEFAPDLTAVLSMPDITPRPSSKNADERASKITFLNSMSPDAQSLYKDSMQNYVMSILGELDSKMPSDKKIFKGGHVGQFTDYGKFVTDMVTSDIMKYGIIKALFPYEDLITGFAADGKPEYSENLKYMGLKSLGINEPNKPENDAKVLLKLLQNGFNDIQNDDNSDLIDALFTRFKDVDLDDIKMARAVVNKTGAGLNWRFDAAKDVADFDKRRANNSQASFERCWDNVIDFWGGFIGNIKKHNPAAYTIAEVTNLWEFSRWQYSSKNQFAIENIENLESNATAEQKAALLKFYADNKDTIPADDMDDNIKRSLNSKLKLTYADLADNPKIITDQEFRKLRDYYCDLEKAKNAMQSEDFGKYIDPNTAERMLYEKTGATTGSNYDTFFGLYPELFGQNFEHGTTDNYRLYNMAAFENGLKGFFSAHTPHFINHSHIFTNNHDKPRPLHCMALDMKLFLGNLKDPEDKARARAVTKSNDFDHTSSMAVAVGEKFLEMFKQSYKGIISENELKTVEQAVADLVLGKFLNHTKGSIERSRTFGYSPFDITLKDVILQARYLSETKGMEWNISEGKKTGDLELSAKEEKLFKETFSKLEPDTEKLSAMLRMMMFSVGIPTIFEGDEMAHTGYETPTKNVELAIRNIVHHSWIDDEDMDFVQKLYNHTTAAANVHKMKELSAIADGSPLIVPQKSKDDEGDRASHTALFKYNDKGSNVLVVYSNKQMDTENKNARANLSGEVDKISHIDLEYLDANGNKSGNSVAKDGDKFKKLKYNPATAKYEPGKENYIVKGGKLVREGMVTRSGASTPGSIELDDIANIFYKIN